MVVKATDGRGQAWVDAGTFTAPAVTKDWQCRCPRGGSRRRGRCSSGWSTPSSSRSKGKRVKGKEDVCDPDRQRLAADPQRPGGRPAPGRGADARPQACSRVIAIAARESRSRSRPRPRSSRRWASRAASDHRRRPRRALDPPRPSRSDVPEILTSTPRRDDRQGVFAARPSLTAVGDGKVTGLLCLPPFAFCFGQEGRRQRAAAGRFSGTVDDAPRTIPAGQGPTGAGATGMGTARWPCGGGEVLDERLAEMARDETSRPVLSTS